MATPPIAAPARIAAMPPRLIAVLAAPVLAAVVWSAGGGGLPVLAPTPEAAGGHPTGAVVTDGSGPAKAYDCTFNINTDAYTGAYGTASAIGWRATSKVS